MENKHISEARAMLQRTAGPDSRQGLRHLFPAIPQPWQQMMMFKSPKWLLRVAKVTHRLLLSFSDVALQDINYQF